ncbi:Rmd6p ASCRUDRAFT_70991 [Ascoidea rubescens DSM 1968]|uniref:Uncharacterized protein n=1 Tax=Ascoidea rubescens DSM 1968 TaxID=1344418 RepID=A0A1D2VFX1_9ASCO|nr:hypothetical protein ASCRUDRAFT_70991 [Ascoidea rubescens DSM 1968]ODV60489.1 hypothetical protein ASCRUDRAFT_70991 [Ascoidea rubescens DSM 1968]
MQNNTFFNGTKHPVLLKFPSSLLKGFSKGSVNFRENLTALINRAYNKPRLRYNIILTERIKHHDDILLDLGLDKSSSNCYIYCLLVPRDWLGFTSDELIERFQKSTTTNSTQTVLIEHESEFRFNKEINDRVVGIIGIKPFQDLDQTSLSNVYGESYSNMLELTSFCSFKSKTGPLLFNLMKNDIHLSFPQNFKKIVAIVIVEHNLVFYYEKILNFIKIDNSIVKIKLKSGQSTEKNVLLEGGIKATRDFHLQSLYINL